MAQLDLTLEGLFQRAFGDRGRPYEASIIEQVAEALPEYEYEDPTPSEGTEFLTVRQQLNARLADGRQIFMPMRLGGVLLPNEPSVAVRRRK
ncbi:MAG: hypothetical protein D6772_05800, partial [Bacteroidetes bacterium]